MSSFIIQRYERCYLPGMLALYNSETANEPHIAPLNAERFAALVESKACFDPAGLLVALEGNEVVGWVHSCEAPGSEAWQPAGDRMARIRMLLFRRDRPRAGAALVSEATAWLRGLGHDTIEAMHARAGYPLYRGLWMGSEPMCPAAFPHVHAALETAGFVNSQESLFMTAAVPAPPRETPTALAVDMVDAPAAMAHDGMRDSWTGFQPMVTRAMAGAEVAGNVGWVVLPHVADRLGAPCLNVWCLSVADPYRRRGVATALVTRALRLGYERGARFASVTTQLWNAPAQATYARAGFTAHALLIGRSYDGPASAR